MSLKGPAFLLLAVPSASPCNADTGEAGTFLETIAVVAHATREQSTGQLGAPRR